MYPILQILPDASGIIAMNCCYAEVGCCYEPELLNFGVWNSNYQISHPNHGIVLIMLLCDRIGRVRFDGQLPGYGSGWILLRLGRRKIGV